MLHIRAKAIITTFKGNAEKSNLALLRMLLYNGWINFHHRTAGKAQQKNR